MDFDEVIYHFEHRPLRSQIWAITGKLIFAHFAPFLIPSMLFKWTVFHVERISNCSTWNNGSGFRVRISSNTLVNHAPSVPAPLAQGSSLAFFPYLRAERAWLLQSDSMVHASWVTGSGVSLTITSGASVASERSEQLRTVRHATRAAPVFRSPTSIYMCVRRKKFDSWVAAHINKDAQWEKATLLPR